MSFYAIRIEIIIVDKKLLKMIKNKTNENLMEIITNYIYIYIFNDKIYDKRYVGAI